MFNSKKSNKRIFLLGDSFTDNLFAIELNRIKSDGMFTGEIAKYVDYILKYNDTEPKYFDDWLTEWGYDVYNYGKGGCSMDDIILQFRNIDENFREGDRIILNFTSYERFNLQSENGSNLCVHNNGLVNDEKDEKIINFLLQQCINRNYSFYNNKSIKQEMHSFVLYLIRMHSHYKPIIWSPFSNIESELENEKFFIYNTSHQKFTNLIKNKNLLIEEESGGKFKDRHYGRYGNYYMALIFKTILEHKNNTSYYINDIPLMQKIEDILKNDIMEFHFPKFRNLI